MDTTHPAQEEKVLIPDHPRDLVIVGLSATVGRQSRVQQSQPKPTVAALTGGT